MSTVVLCFLTVPHADSRAPTHDSTLFHKLSLQKYTSLFLCPSASLHVSLFLSLMPNSGMLKLGVSLGRTHADDPMVADYSGVGHEIHRSQSSRAGQHKTTCMHARSAIRSPPSTRQAARTHTHTNPHTPFQMNFVFLFDDQSLVHSLAS